MAKLANLAKMTTATTGTGTITLGSAAVGFISFAAAGISDGDVVTYAIRDGTASEIGRGTYASSGTTLTRTVLKSTNSNTAISLSGAAEVFLTAAAEDFMKGPASSTDSNAAAFDGTSGLLLKDSGKAFPSGTVVGTSDSQTLTNKTLTDPIVGTQAANDNSTKAASTAYVDTAVAFAVQGLDPKASVRAATTASGTLASAFANGQTVDGVTLATGNRILIKNQSSGAENGIYVVAVSGAPTRATDFDSWTEVPGAFCFVEEGTVNGNTGWTCTNDIGGTIGSTSVVFAQFSGAGSFTASTGLQLTGTAFSIDSTVATLTGAQALTNKTVNGNTFTSGTYTLTGVAGKTLTFSNSLTLAGTDSTTMTFPPASAAVGYMNVPINPQSTAYTAVLADAGKCLFHPSTDANARTFTIPANASVAYDVGTVLTFINETSQVVTIAITSDTLTLAGTGSTGSRSLAQHGIATAIKKTSTTWHISGVGLT